MEARHGFLLPATDAGGGRAKSGGRDESLRSESTPISAVRRLVFLSWPRVRVDLEAAVKRSADGAGLGLRDGVVVFDSFDEQTTTYALEDGPGLEVFFRFEDVLRIAGDQRGGVDLVYESPHKRIIA